MSTSTAPGVGARSSKEPVAAAAGTPDSMLAQVDEDDAVALFFARNWRTIAVVLAAVAIGMFAYNAFQSTAQAKRAAATHLFGDIRERYNELVRKQTELVALQGENAESSQDAKKAEESKKKIEALEKEISELHQKTGLMIESLDGPAPFDTLAGLYRGLVAARFGDAEPGKAALSSAAWEGIAATKPERLVAEMTAFGLAKAIGGFDAGRDASRNALTALAERGGFAAVQSGIALAYMAQTPEEIAKAKELIANLERRFPAQQKNLDDAMSQVE